MRPAPGAPRRFGDALLATWTVAGVLIALVFSVAPLEEGVRAMPWLMGPCLWVVTAAASTALLRTMARWEAAPAAALAATVAGGAADGLVVAAGWPWPGLVVGVAVFSAVVALWGGEVRRRAASARNGSVGDARRGMGGQGGPA